MLQIHGKNFFLFIYHMNIFPLVRFRTVSHYTVSFPSLPPAWRARRRGGGRHSLFCPFCAGCVLTSETFPFFLSIVLHYSLRESYIEGKNYTTTHTKNLHYILLKMVKCLMKANLVLTSPFHRKKGNRIVII